MSISSQPIAVRFRRAAAALCATLAGALHAQVQSFHALEFEGTNFMFLDRFVEQGGASTFGWSATGGMLDSGRVTVGGNIRQLYYNVPVSGFMDQGTGHTIQFAFQARSTNAGLASGNLSIATGLIPRVTDVLGDNTGANAFLSLQIGAQATPAGASTQFTMSFRSRDGVNPVTAAPASPVFTLTNLNWYRLTATFQKTWDDLFVVTATLDDLGPTGGSTPAPLITYESTLLANSYFQGATELFPAIRAGAPTGLGTNGIDSFRLQLYPDPAVATRNFPWDSGVVDVQSYGATGDGWTDDTTAIQNAICENVGKGKILYFPNGTYRVSKTLRYIKVVRSPDVPLAADWAASLKLQGQSRDGTILKLADGTFTNAAAPQAVIKTGSQAAWDANGTGDQAFMNSVCNLTVDVGSNNAGAIGVDFLASNQGTLRDVRIVSTDPNKLGHTGVSMTRSPGPCIVKNVEVDGFQTGIRTAGNALVNTFENLRLVNQSKAAVWNDNLVLAIRNLLTSGGVPAYVDYNPATGPRTNAAGLLVLDQAMLLGSNSGQIAIGVGANSLIRNSLITGFRPDALTIRGAPVGSASGFFLEHVSRTVAPMFSPSITSSLDLPAEETPVSWDNALENWVSAGEPLGTGASDNAHIQAAIDNAPAGSTLYFPSGKYYLHTTVTIGPNIRHVVGMMSEFVPTAGSFTSGSVIPVFQINTPAASISGQVIEDIWIRMSGASKAVAFAHLSAKPVTLKNINIFCGGGAYTNVVGSSTGTGKVFFEDFAPHGHVKDTIAITGQQAWARHLNSETGNSSGPMVTNTNGTLWILGFKTEDRAPFVRTVNGKTEVLGAYHWLNTPTSAANEALVPYESVDSDISVSFASSLRPPGAQISTKYTDFLSEKRGATTHYVKRVPPVTSPNRNTFGRAVSVPTSTNDTDDSGRVVPLYVGAAP